MLSAADKQQYGARHASAASRSLASEQILGCDVGCMQGSAMRPFTSGVSRYRKPKSKIRCISSVVSMLQGRGSKNWRFDGAGA